MNAQRILLSLLAIVLAGIAVLWFVEHYELKEVDYYTGYRGEARENDLFAARLFLKRMGIPAQRKDDLYNLPDTDTVILLNTPRYTLGIEQINKLLAWVEAGGHLIAAARVTENNGSDTNKQLASRDPLQARLKVHTGEHIMPDSASTSQNVQLANMPENLTVNLNFFYELIPQTSADNNARSYAWDEHVWLLQQPYGNGLVSLVAETHFLENYGIADVDHAEFFWYLLHSAHEHIAGVWLLHRDDHPSLLALLRQYAWPILMSSTVLLLFVFWALVPRFGAVVYEPTLHRRRLLEHIRASSQFLWKQQNEDAHKGRSQLIASSRQAIKQRSRQTIHGWDLMDQDERYAAICEQLNYQTTEQSNYFNHLMSATTLHEGDFIELVRIANQLRNPS